MEYVVFVEEKVVVFELGCDWNYVVEEMDDWVFFGFDGFFGCEKDFDVGENEEVVEDLENLVLLY